MHKPFYTHSLFLIWFLLLVLIAVLHLVALEYFLYWVYTWFDILMHFLGGLFIALSILWFVFESGYVHVARTVNHAVLVAGLSIFFVGVGWEIFEVIAGIPIEDNFVFDTITDLTMDACGAAVGIIIFNAVYLRDIQHIHGEEK